MGCSPRPSSVLQICLRPPGDWRLGSVRRVGVGGSFLDAEHPSPGGARRDGESGRPVLRDGPTAVVAYVCGRGQSDPTLGMPLTVRLPLSSLGKNMYEIANRERQPGRGTVLLLALSKSRSIRSQKSRYPRVNRRSGVRRVPRNRRTAQALRRLCEA